MTKEEFEGHMGHEVSDTMYIVANACYEGGGYDTQKAFVRDWKAIVGTRAGEHLMAMAKQEVVIRHKFEDLMSALR